MDFYEAVKLYIYFFMTPMKIRIRLPALFLLYATLLATQCLVPGDSPGSSQKQTEYRKVVFVYDGDTVQLDTGEHIRYLGVNCPEMDHREGRHEPFALEAKQFNEKAVRGSRVRLEFDQERYDDHGRLLAYLFLQDGTMVNNMLLQKGLGHVFLGQPGLRYRDLFVNAQRKAMTEGVGLWKRLPKGKEPFYWGNQKSYRFHRPSCPLGEKISPKSRIRLKGLYESFWEGFSPCRICRPQDG